MNTYGLIGFPLDHSFSPTYFNEKFYREGIEGAIYQLFPLERIDHLPEFLKDTPGLSGLNVTIPYKKSVLPFLDDLDPAAEIIGAVNTITIADGKTKGYNTDAFAFQDSLEPLLKKHYRQALILGTGGAAEAVAYALDQLFIPYRFVSRTPEEDQYSYKQLEEQSISQHQIIINATPLGMAPNELEFPDIPYQYISKNHLLYDLIYNPNKTVFLIKGQQQGANIKNGLEMLHMQAEMSWNIWKELDH